MWINRLIALKLTISSSKRRSKRTSIMLESGRVSRLGPDLEVGLWNMMTAGGTLPLQTQQANVNQPATQAPVKAPSTTPGTRPSTRRHQPIIIKDPRMPSQIWTPSWAVWANTQLNCWISIDWRLKLKILRQGSIVSSVSHCKGNCYTRIIDLVVEHPEYETVSNLKALQTVQQKEQDSRHLELLLTLLWHRMSMIEMHIQNAKLFASLILMPIDKNDFTFGQKQSSTDK